MDSVRALLLVPPNKPQANVPADAILLDLTHTDRSDLSAAAAAVDALLAAGRRVYLHTCGPQSPDLREYLLATLHPGVYGLSLPNATHIDQVRYVDSLLEDVEDRAGIEIGLTALGIWIGSAAALAQAGEFARASHRLTWLGLASSQLAAELRLDQPSPALLNQARVHVVFAAQAAGIPAVEILPVHDAVARELRALGLLGALTRNAQEVPTLQAEFQASPPEPAPANS